MVEEVMNYKQQMEELVITGMREYAEEYDSELLDGVEKCEKLLTDFLDRLSRNHNPKEAMEQVKWIVEQLNDLNEEYNAELIETDEREALCEYIFGALRIVGIEVEEDVTEEWREW